MKEKETVNRGELESINREMFNSFDLEDASWIVGGKPKFTLSATNFVATTDNGGFSPQVDTDIDIAW